MEEFRATTNNMSEYDEIDNEVASDIGMIVFFGLLIVSLGVWFICCSVHRVTVRC